jgi:hypothetical protein
VASWRPQDITRLVIGGTGALCLVLVILGTFCLLLTGKIRAADIGSIKGVSEGSGIAILAGCASMVMVKGIPK